MKAYCGFLNCRLPLIGDIYFDGDIIEVLNGVQKIGSRYRVKCFVDNEMIKKPRSSDFNEFSQLNSDPLNNNAYIHVTLSDFTQVKHHSEIMLYKRPFKNWIKLVLSKILGIYIK